MPLAYGSSVFLAWHVEGKYAVLLPTESETCSALNLGINGAGQGPNRTNSRKADQEQFVLTLEDHQELAAHTADQLRELIREGGWCSPFKIEWAGADDRAIFWFVTDGKQMLQSDPNDPVEDSEFPVTISITDINGRHLWMKIERVAPH